MDQKRAIAAFARAPVSRLDMFRLLLQVRPEGMPAGAIAERLGGQPSLPSFHLTQLGHADV
jgi:ArsR family transcriptional regulator